MEIKTINFPLVKEKKCVNQDSNTDCRLPDKIPECYNDCVHFKQEESKDDIIEIKLSLAEARSIMISLMRTKYLILDDSNILMELEDKLCEEINNK